MDWYYAEGTERKGPLSEEAFQQLVQQGVISSETLVWREGFADWRPYAQSAAPPVIAQAPPAGGVACAGCGRNFSPNDVIPLGEGLYCATCKPLALQRLKEGVHSNTAAETIRNEHIRHEASVKSIGFLYFLGAIGTSLVGIATLLTGSSSPAAARLPIVFSLFLVALGVGQFCVGMGLRRLRNWARIPTGILSGIGLLGFPLGTIINAYILYLIFSQKGKMVFSDEYQVVIQQTPHIKYRTSVIVWILLGLLVLLFGVAIIGVFAKR